MAKRPNPRRLSWIVLAVALIVGGAFAYQAVDAWITAEYERIDSEQ